MPEDPADSIWAEFLLEIILYLKRTISLKETLLNFTMAWWMDGHGKALQLHEPQCSLINEFQSKVLIVGKNK